MANELSYPGGLPITLAFQVANVAANATTNLTLAQAGTGFEVPTGYKFHAVFVQGGSNADLTAGAGVINVTSNGTALANGPTVTLNDTVQRATDVERVGAEPVAAGKIIGCNIVADANFAPNTADLDVLIVGLLLPA
jgi:hypothetical protein